MCHNTYPIIRHIKVTGSKSPYDGDDAYWAKWLKKTHGLSKTVKILLKRQNNICALCKRHFTFGCVKEIDHIKPKSSGGKNAYSNLQLLHGHCHDQKHAMYT